jgi:inositol 3-alpha-galactosyltransferase
MAVHALKLEAPKSNLILRKCEYLLPPNKNKISLIAKRFEDTYSKLRVFKLFEYDIVCFLNVDMAIFGNIDSVFDKAADISEGQITATHAYICNLDGDKWALQD